MGLIAAFTASIIENNAEQAAFDGLTLLNKLVENKVKSPEEAKFNSFKKTNPKVVDKILSLQGGINDLIQALGFTSTADDRYEFTGDLRVLKKGNKAIEQAIEPMKVARMTPEERAKHELMAAQKRQYQAQRQAEKARMDEQKRLQQADRQEKATEEVKASKANQLKFGANLVQFKPPVNR